MGPLRILILAALLYIGYRLISANFKKDNDEQKQEGNGKSEEQGPAETETVADSGTVTDVLVEDPVCRKLVPKQQARTVESDGVTHFFCSQECADAFVAGKEQSD